LNVGLPVEIGKEGFCCVTIGLALSGPFRFFAFTGNLHFLHVDPLSNLKGLHESIGFGFTSREGSHAVKDAINLRLAETDVQAQLAGHGKAHGVQSLFFGYLRKGGERGGNDGCEGQWAQPF
jgi:hypothetical protein